MALIRPTQNPGARAIRATQEDVVPALHENNKPFAGRYAEALKARHDIIDKRRMWRAVEACIDRWRVSSNAHSKEDGDFGVDNGQDESQLSIAAIMAFDKLDELGQRRRSLAIKFRTFVLIHLNLSIEQLFPSSPQPLSASASETSTSTDISERNVPTGTSSASATDGHSSHGQIESRTVRELAELWVPLALMELRRVGQRRFYRAPPHRAKRKRHERHRAPLSLRTPKTEVVVKTEESQEKEELVKTEELPETRDFVKTEESPETEDSVKIEIPERNRGGRRSARRKAFIKFAEDLERLDAERAGLRAYHNHEDGLSATSDETVVGGLHQDY